MADPGPVFRDVDADDAARLVAMMDATDRWPAVRAIRAWLRDQVDLDGSTVADVGSGPGTFGNDARGRGARTIDLDRSAAMLAELRRRRRDAVAVQADVLELPLGDGSVDVVHAERILQWTTDPSAALGELRRIVAPGGCLAVTDTDWGTFAVDLADPDGADRWSAAALAWVPHPTFARSLPRRLADLGAATVAARADAVALTEWDPDEPDQFDGPPGLPLRTIAASAPPGDRAAAAADLAALAAAARSGRFLATLTLVTAVARF